MALTAGLEHASLVRPCQGERVSGDAVVITPIEGGLFAAIVDVDQQRSAGLGAKVDADRIVRAHRIAPFSHFAGLKIQK